MRPQPSLFATARLLVVHALALGQLALMASLLLLCMGFATGASAATKTYTDNGDGTVTDATTGLIWMRCSMGQTWEGGTCSGTASPYTWDQAVALTGTQRFAGRSDWRLPNIRELQTILDRSTFNPAIDSAAFPATPSWFFWSSSRDPYSWDYAWDVYFLDARASSNGRGNSRHTARLVRGGQSFGPLLNITRPSSDYVDQGDGTVTHSPTNLMWKRCAEGQQWSGTTCIGEASSLTAIQASSLSAIYAGHTDWRLPTIDELVSLVDYSLSAVNSSIFPAAPWSKFLSGSFYGGYQDDLWNIIGNGSTGGLYRYGNYDYAVRLVRGGQSINFFDTDADKVFAWAERTYATIFGPVGQSSQTIPGYRVRAYTGGHYLGVNDSGTAHLYYLGPLSNNSILDLGLLSGWLAQAGP